MPYSTPTEGFVTLWPNKDLGSDFGWACLLAGVSKTHPRLANGFAVIRRGMPERIAAVTEEQARMAVLSKMETAEPVDLLRAVAIGKSDRIVFQRFERIGSTAESHASSIVTPSGKLIVKRAVTPLDVEDVATRLSGRLAWHDAQWSKPLLKKYLEQLDINWGNASDTQIDRAFAKGARFLKKANLKPLIEPWEKRVQVELGYVSNGTRQYIKETFLPRIAPAFRQPDKQAIEQLGKQQGWWLRDEMGKRSDRLTNRGREIVQDGLKRGFGRREIGSELQSKLPELWSRYGNNYANAVAAVAVNRARSFSEVASYRDASIEYLEVVAVLDEATTEFCRYMDGQIISVSSCFDLLGAGANVARPEDIKTVNPFMKMGRDDDGTRFIQTANGVRLADVVSSGVGISSTGPGSNIDTARGTVNAHLMGNQLPVNALVGAPPYHHLCFSSDTEVLTESRGFVLFSELTGEEKVMTVELPTLKPEYQSIKKKISYHYNGPMVHFTGPHVDCLVTPDHNMVVSITRKYHFKRANQCWIDQGIPVCHRMGEAWQHGRIKMMASVEYNDTVYCVEVERHNTLVVRRNNQILISGNCRTRTVPAGQIFQVPAGYQMRTMAGNPANALPKKTSPKPQVIGGLPRNMFAPTPTPKPKFEPQKVGRPGMLIPDPVTGHPTMVGELPYDELDPFAVPGLVDGVSLERQAIRRMSDEAKRINAEISKEIERNGGNVLKPKKRGEVIRDSMKKKPPTKKSKGRESEAMAIVWEMFRFSNRKPMVDGDTEIHMGNWGDISIGSDSSGKVLVDVVRDAMADGQEQTLDLLWSVNPQHIGFVAALNGGMFR